MAQRLLSHGSAPYLRWKNRNVNTQVYFECMEDVVRTVASQWPRGQWADPNFQVKIQQDGARPHTSAQFKNLWENLLVALAMEGVLPFADKVTLLTQPPNSPDLNLNDNGFFNALQAGYKRFAPRNDREMIDAVQEVWSKYPAQRINHMWLTLQANFNAIIEVHGGNDYKSPHMAKEKLERQNRLPIVLEVSDKARELVEEGGSDNEEEGLTDLQEAEVERLENTYGRMEQSELRNRLPRAGAERDLFERRSD